MAGGADCWEETLSRCSSVGLQEGPFAWGQQGGGPGGLPQGRAELCGHCSSAFRSCVWEGPPVGVGTGSPAQWRCLLLVFPCRKEPLHQRIRSDQIGESSCSAGLGGGRPQGLPPAALSPTSLLAGAHQVPGPTAAPGISLLQAARQCRYGPGPPAVGGSAARRRGAAPPTAAHIDPPPHLPPFSSLSQKEFLRFITSAPAGNTTPWCWSCWAPAWRISLICATAPSPSKPS